MRSLSTRHNSRESGSILSALASAVEKKANTPQGAKRLVTVIILVFVLVNVLILLVGVSFVSQHAQAEEASDLTKKIVGIHHSPNAAKNSIGALTRDLVDLALTHPLHGPAAVLANETLVCHLSLLHALPDALYLNHDECTMAEVVHNFLGGVAHVSRFLPARCRESGYWRQQEMIVRKDSRTRHEACASTLPPPLSAAATMKYEIATAIRRTKSLHGGDGCVPKKASVAAKVENDASCESTMMDSFRNNQSDVSHAKAKKAEEKESINFHHLGYTTPEINILSHSEEPLVRRRKLFLFMPLLPGRHPEHHGPYVFSQPSDEVFYRAFLERSLFAFTHNRGGWESFRTLEIIAAGSLPYFADFPARPGPWVLSQLPAKMIDATLKLVSAFDPRLAAGGGGKIGIVKSLDGPIEKEDSCCFYREGPGHINFHRVPRFNGNRGLDDDDAFSLQYSALRSKMLDFARNKLTTKAMARRLLHDIFSGDASRAMCHRRPLRLLIVSDGAWEYETVMLLVGLASLPEQHEIIFVGQPRLKEALIQKQQQTPSGDVDDAAAAEDGDVSAHERSLSGRVAAGAYGAGFGFLKRISASALGRVKFVANHEIFGRGGADGVIGGNGGGGGGGFDAAIWTFVAPRTAGSGDVLRMYPLLSEVLKSSPSRMTKLAFVDGSDAELVSPLAFRDLADALEKSNYHHVTFFARELTLKHFDV